MTLQELLGIKLPIIQAPMAGVQDSALALSVSQYGGLGSLPCAMLSPDALRRELLAMQKQTSKPYNLNFFCHTPLRPNAEREAAWRELLSPYYREYGIDPSSIPAGSGRTPFNAEAAELVEEFRPGVVSFHFGLPSRELLERVKATGAKVLSSATTVEEAGWLEERGVDAVIAQGIEAGGHRGLFLTTELSTQQATFALVSQLLDILTVPVIAAGGIADAKDVAAAVTLGAAGVQVGTSYLLCPEATTKPVHRTALKSPQAVHTVITNIFTGRPARGIVNRIIRELGPINSTAPDFPLAAAAIAPLRAKAEAQDCGDFSPLWAGQNASGVKEISAGELTEELAAGL